MPAPKFTKPPFANLLANYRTEPTSVHECLLIDPTKDAINTCAARMTEALVIVNRLVKTRPEITKLGTGKGDGTSYLLGKFDFARFGKLCPHGIARGAADTAAFLHHHWGTRTLGWTAQPQAPADVQGKTGLVVFMTIPGFSGQGHVDLWNKTGPVGHDYWNAATIWFWEMG